MRRWLPFVGSFLVPMGVAMGRLAHEYPDLLWSPIAGALSLLLIVLGSASWFLHIFTIDYEERGGELLRAFLVFLLFSYLIFRLLD